MKNLLAFSLLLPISTLITAQGAPNCTVFNWNGQPGFLLNDTDRPVSAGFTCPNKANESHACPIEADGDVQLLFSYNITSVLRDSFWQASGTSQSFLHNLISAEVSEALSGTPWQSTTVGSIDTTQKLNPGTAGVIWFTPWKRCFEGTMSNCTGGVEDGVGIQACAPVYQQVESEGGVPVIDGVYEVVEVLVEDVGNYRDPFGAQSRSAAFPGARISGFSIGAVMSLALVMQFM